MEHYGGKKMSGEMNKTGLVEEKVFEIVKEYVNVENDNDINIDTDFEEMNINSVDFIKIIVRVETDFDFEFYDDDLTMGRFNNMHELIDYIIERTK